MEEQAAEMTSATINAQNVSGAVEMRVGSDEERMSFYHLHKVRMTTQEGEAGAMSADQEMNVTCVILHLRGRLEVASDLQETTTRRLIQGEVSRLEKHRSEVREEVIGQRSLEDQGVKMREEMLVEVQGIWVGLRLHRLDESGRARTLHLINPRGLAVEDNIWLREGRKFCTMAIALALVAWRHRDLDRMVSDGSSHVLLT